MFKYLPIALFPLFSSVLFSQEAIELETFVVTAQYEKTTKEKAVNKIKVIDREKIEAIGAVNLRDVLSNENNIRISQDNVLGSFMSLQGISGQNVKILIDGVPIIGRLNGSVDLSQINLNDIERIEIVEGPLSVNYGTDALAGTINLISKKKTSDGFSVNLNSYYESIGQYNFDGTISYKQNNNQFNFSAGRNFFDGWDPNDPFLEFPESRLADTTRVKQWNPKEQWFSKLSHIYSNSNFSIRSYATIFDEQITNRGMPRAPYYQVAFDDYYNTLRSDVGFDVKKKFNEKSELRIIAAYNYYRRIKNTFVKDLTNLEQQITPSQDDQDTTKFDLIMSRGTFSKVKGKLNYQLGYDVNVESSLGRRIEGNVQSQSDFAIFGGVQWMPIDQLVVKPALRLAYNTSYKAPPIPSLNIKYNLLNSITFRGSYARGFRAPGLKELYFYFVDINHNIVGNRNLSEEQSNNFILDLVWKKVYSNCVFDIDGGGYYNDINKLITLAQSEENPQQYTYVNIGKFKTLGLQFNSSINIKNSIKFNFGIAQVGRYNRLSDSIELDLPSFNFSPEIRSNIVYNNNKYGLRFSAFYKYTGKATGFFIDSDGNVTESILESFSMLDANVSKSFSDNSIQWTIGFKNLLDVQSLANAGPSGVHSSASGQVPMSWGRSFFTALKFKF